MRKSVIFGGALAESCTLAVCPGRLQFNKIPTEGTYINRKKGDLQEGNPTLNVNTPWAPSGPERIRMRHAARAPPPLIFVDRRYAACILLQQRPCCKAKGQGKKSTFFSLCPLFP